MKKKEILNYLMKGDEADLLNLEPEVLGIIGVELKRRRLQQSRTLDSFACGCSISYISKIENGRINPKYSILQELCNEQGIAKEELDCLIKINSFIEQAIVSTFYGKHYELNESCEQFENFDNYKVNLLRALNYLNYHDYDDAKKMIESLEYVVDKLVPLDFNIFIYLKMMLLINDYKFLDAHKLYFRLKAIDNKILNTMCYKAYFIALCNCGLENPTHYYAALCKKYNELLSVETNDVKKLYFETLVKLNYQLPEVIVGSMEIHYQIIYAYLHLDFEKLRKLYNLGLNAYDKLLIAMSLQEYEIAQKCLLELDYSKLKEKDNIIANLSKYIIEGHEMAMNQFIVNEAIPYAEERGDFSLLSFLVKFYSEKAMCTGKYKSVTSICISYFDLLEQYKRIY